MVGTGVRASSLTGRARLGRLGLLCRNLIRVSVDLHGLRLIRSLGSVTNSIKSKRLEDSAVHHAVAHVRPSPVCCDDSEAQLQRVGHRGDPLRPAWVLTDDNSISPVGYVSSDPLGEQRLSDQVVNRALEEALHLAGVQVHCNDMVDSRNVHEVGQHAGGDGASVALLLGLAGVWEVWDDGWPERVSSPFRGRVDCGGRAHQ